LAQVVAAGLYACAEWPDLHWEKIALLGIGVICLIFPLLQTGQIGADGGSFAKTDPLDMIAKVRDEAAAGRSETFVQTNQQIGQVIAQLSELSDQIKAMGLSHDRVVPTDPALAKGEPTIEALKERLPPVSNSGDPQSGRFGGQEIRNGRKLSALVSPSAIGGDWQKVTMIVEASAEKPLTGSHVWFFVHDTFSPDVYRIKIDEKTNRAEMTLTAYGAFTVGAITDRGETLLELNLANSGNVIAPKDWQNR
jgi:hypothetical protein